MDLRDFIKRMGVDLKQLTARLCECYYTIEKTDNLLAKKQNNLIAGNNITLVENSDGTFTISAAEAEIFRIVPELPAVGEPNLIYIVPRTVGEENNQFDEYIWIEDTQEWELIGSFSGGGGGSVDLSGVVPWVSKTDRRIVLDNNKGLQGTETTGQVHNLIELSEFDVVDVGSEALQLNLNSSVRPTIQIGNEIGLDAEEMAFLKDLDYNNKKIIWVDTAYEGISTGSSIAPFNKIQDAIDSITDSNRREIRLSPGNYKAVEPTITINKNVAIIGNVGAFLNTVYSLGDVVVASPSYCNLTGVGITNITGDPGNIYMELSNCIISNTINLGTVGIFSATYCRFNDLNVQINITKVNFNCEFYSCTGLAFNVTAAQYVVGTRNQFVAHKGLPNDTAIQIGTGVGYLVLQDCSLAWFNTSGNVYNYRKIVNNSRPIYTFNSSIGDANKVLPNTYYISTYDTDVLSNRVPVNYSTTGRKLSEHLKGIDDALGNSSGVVINYKTQAAPFPTGSLGDMTVITSDGTSTGTYIDVYTWDGFRWSFTSFSTNIKVTNIPDQEVYLNSQTTLVVKNENSTEFRIYKNADNSPKKIMIGGFDNIIELHDSLEYVVENIDMQPTTDVNIDGNFTEVGIGLAINIPYSNNNPPTINTKLNGCNLSNNTQYGNIDNIEITNCYGTNPNNNYTWDLHIDGYIRPSSISLSNNIDINSIYISLNEIIPSQKNIVLKFDNIEFSTNQSPTLTISGSNISFITEIDFNNIRNIQYLQMGGGYYKIDNFQIDAKILNNVDLSNTSFTDPIMLNDMLKSFLTGGMSSGKIYLQGTTGYADPVIINDLISRGINIIQ